MITPLTVNREAFNKPDGSNYNWRGSIDFMLFYKSLVDGFPIEPILKQRYASGSRGVTTLMVAHYIEHRDPYATPNGGISRFLAHIPAFAEALLKADMYWRPLCLADIQVYNWSRQQQVDFVNQCAQQFAPYWHILPSLGNEWSKNGFHPYDFAKPNTPNIWSRGSEVGDTAPPRPGWGYKEWHPRRDWPKVLFGNDDAWYVKEGIDADGPVLDSPMPCIIGEPIGFWDRDIPNRRSSDPNLARVIGGTSIYFARGADFMSEEGLHCDLWAPRTEECAVAFFKAIAQAD